MLGRNLLAEKKGRMINTWPCASRATLHKIAIVFLVAIASVGIRLKPSIYFSIV